MALRLTRATLRRCPPHGGYFPYHFTKINYTVIDDPAHVATRVRMLTEFRRDLGRIAAAWPDTPAGEEAAGLLFVYDVPEISVEAARDRIESAKRLLSTAARPAELYEAFMLLLEVREGYPHSDEISNRADELLSTLEKDRGKELIAGETEAISLREETDLLFSEVQRGGSLLAREQADDIIARLHDVADRSGGNTTLAGRIKTFVANLEKSFGGEPRLGIRFAPRFPGPGARIAKVDPGTGAAKAGLAPGDVILKLGGTTINGLDDLRKALCERKPGEKVEIEVRRVTGQVSNLELLLGRRMR